ncbi:DUF427 domain-containing protein [Arthrobacter sp. JZ12]|uniref:DUF427 domain-containing protein n=1 Tax=Arthrobacter sp. JZ12 TaxID=2654190 RepID=UPI002B45AA45|nr:DUF427 domain-containing protein [Arthrobacter sp. JZ12]WRH25728.1 DUF427 domain-containing protein [Arthrobacter sp. JZ12]
MAAKLSSTMLGLLPELRYEPTPKRIRANLNGGTIVDTQRALLVWEPRRVTPILAVPEDDLAATLSQQTEESCGQEFPFAGMLDGPPVLDPRTAFSRHTTAGTPLTLSSADRTLPGAAFRPDDDALGGYVLLDFDVLTWWEDDEPIIGHPRDPFHRVDIRRTSKHIAVQCEGTLLAETTRAELLYETMLPPRTYIPPDDVRLDLMEPSTTTTVCPYKGQASYYSFAGSSGPLDVAWTYDSRFPDATQIHGLICFFDERADILVDGIQQERPHTPWS